jgi:hypothetical protein
MSTFRPHSPSCARPVWTDLHEVGSYCANTVADDALGQLLSRVFVIHLVRDSLLKNLEILSIVALFWNVLA